MSNEQLELEADVYGIRPSTGREARVANEAVIKLVGAYGTPDAKASLNVKPTDKALAMAIKGLTESLIHLKPELRNKF